MRELHLFAGAGGGILGGILLGHTCVCAVEINAYCRRVLLQRQRDGVLPRFPIWDDIKTFDARPWRGKVDVVCGGFPCQDVSSAGPGVGLEGARSGLWGQMGRVVREVGPRFVFVENSPFLTIRGLGRVVGDLASLGYDARWGVLGGCDAGMPQLRKRIWILADNMRIGRKGHIGGFDFSEARQRGQGRAQAVLKKSPLMPGESWPQPLLCGMDARVASTVDRLQASGNGQVPAVARLAWETLTG